MGKGHTEESRKQISKTLMGHTVSEETKQKISQALMGHPVSAEQRRKQSEAMSGERHPFYGLIGEGTPFYGKHHTEETKRKMSQSQKARQRRKEE